jgi:hypothetical protein
MQLDDLEESILRQQASTNWMRSNNTLFAVEQDEDSLEVFDEDNFYDEESSQSPLSPNQSNDTAREQLFKLSDEGDGETPETK